MKKSYSLKQLSKIIEVSEEGLREVFNRSNLISGKHYTQGRTLRLNEAGSIKLSLFAGGMSAVNKFLDATMERSVYLTITQLKDVILSTGGDPELCPIL